jgi:hypothetical protein
MSVVLEYGKHCLVFPSTGIKISRSGRQISLLSAAGYPQTEIYGAGDVMYGANAPDLLGRAATYVDKILKGAKPADLPVQQPKKLEFIINLETASQIGLTIFSGSARTDGQSDQMRFWISDFRLRRENEEGHE